MNDVTSKPMWTRCKGCTQRIYNEHVDIAAHRANCPADIRRAFQNLERKFSTLEARFDEIDEQLTNEPAVDLDSVAPWPDDDTDDADDLAELDDDFADPTIPATITNLPTIGGIA